MFFRTENQPISQALEILNKKKSHSGKKISTDPFFAPGNFQATPARSTGLLTTEFEKYCRLYNSFVGKITYNRLIN
jgi:hypothetical protein